MPKQPTRSARRLGVFSNNSELRRSFLNLGRLIDLIFRNHVSLAEDSDLKPFKLNSTVAWSDRKEPKIGVSSPYPRRLESLTICRCNYKGSTFSSVI